MKQLIHRGAETIDITYSNFLPPDILIGKNFKAEIIGNDIIFDIDLSGNINTRNKNENTFADALKLDQNRSSLRSIGLSSDHISGGVLKLKKMHPYAKWIVVLNLGRNNLITLPALISFSGVKIEFIFNIV